MPLCGMFHGPMRTSMCVVFANTCSDVLCDEDISQFIGENFLVWGADVTQPDGFECQKMFQVRT